MYTYKRFFWGTVGIIGFVVLFNFLTWYFATGLVLSGNPAVGDLARMGYLPELVKLEKVGGAPGGKHLSYSEYTEQPIDIVILGDSFSNGGGMNYHQDYIAGRLGLTILNLTDIFTYPRLSDRLDPIVNLVNIGFFKRIKPRYLLLQNVERLGALLARDVEWNADSRATDYTAFLEAVKKHDKSKALQKKGFFNNAGFKYWANVVTYRFLGHDYKSKVYKSKLKTELFASDNTSALAFLDQDLQWAGKETDKIAERINSNMNRLAAMLNKQGIQLIYMPAVDKYDLYSDYIIDNVYPKPKFFEKLRTLPRDYVLIDTKEILAAELAMGERDIFWPDDTHWSWKASQSIANSLTLN